MTRRICVTWLVLAALAGGFALAAAGCQSAGIYLSDDDQYLPPPTGPGVVADPHSPIPDVPMPVGFVVVTSESSATVTDGQRTVNHVYQGRAALRDVVAFYRNVLPQNNWKPTDEQAVGDETIMNYTKGNETLQVRVSQPHYVTTIKVYIRTQNPSELPSMP